ncbi:unnamed protein product [Knipowitschia caucasica]
MWHHHCDPKEANRDSYGTKMCLDLCSTEGTHTHSRGRGGGRGRLFCLVVEQHLTMKLPRFKLCPNARSPGEKWLNFIWTVIHCRRHRAIKP